MVEIKQCRDCTHRLVCSIYQDVWSAIGNAPMVVHIDVEFVDGLAMRCSEYCKKLKES